MKIAPTHLFATEIRFGKFSAVSIFSNYFYSLERKPRKAGNFKNFQNFEFC